jgi:hypothetical protein
MNRIARRAGGRFRGHVRQLWESRGGGFYGFVVVLTFLYLETVDLAGDIAGVGGVRLDIGWVIGFLVENAVDAVLNGVRAALWPVTWVGRFGVTASSAALLGGAYVAYRLVRPIVLRLLAEPGAPATLGPPGDSPSD